MAREKAALPVRRQVVEAERTIAVLARRANALGAGAAAYAGEGSVAPQARLAGTLFAAGRFVAGQEGLGGIDHPQADQRQRRHGLTSGS